MEHTDHKPSRVPLLFLFLITAIGLVFFFLINNLFGLGQSGTSFNILLLCTIFGLTSLFFLFLSFSGWYKARLKKEKAILAEDLLRFQSLSTATNDAIWDYNLITGETYYNDTLFVIFGYKKDDVKDNHNWWRSNIHPDDKERVITGIELKLSSQLNSWNDNYRFKHQDGTYKTIYDRCYIVRDSKQRAVRLIGSMVDITQMRGDNEREMNELLEKKNRSGRVILELFEQKQKEIRTQLHEEVAQDLAALKFTLSSKENSKDEHVISQSVDHLNSSIQKIRDISGKIYPATVENFNMADAVKDLIANTENETGISIDLFIDEELNRNRFNDSSNYLLYRIIDLQLQNITAHASANTVMIELHETKDKKICLVISDNGTGADKESISEGKGFAEIKSSIEMYNGSLNIITAKNKGFTIEVQI